MPQLAPGFIPGWAPFVQIWASLCAFVAFGLGWRGGLCWEGGGEEKEGEGKGREEKAKGLIERGPCGQRQRDGLRAPSLGYLPRREKNAKHLQLKGKPAALSVHTEQLGGKGRPEPGCSDSVCLRICLSPWFPDAAAAHPRTTL